MSRLRARYQTLISQGPQGPLETGVYYGLLPLARLYGWIGRLRKTLYQRGLLSSLRCEVPVVSVGNLAVGGTGKTPLVDWIVRYLLARNKRVAVVSRGYGGSGAGEIGVVSDGTQLLLSAAVAGDEPHLLAKRNPGLIVLVAPRRRLGVRAAIDRFGAEVIVLDDGFQHLAVQRDLDIVLLDAQRPFGNGQVLPAGLLREEPRALERGDLFVLTRAVAATLSPPELPGPHLLARHLLGDVAVSLDGSRRPLDTLRPQRVAAFAGIAHPQAFFADLRAKGFELVAELSFPDHVQYGAAETARIAAVAEQVDCLLTTEKDAVKLTPIRFPVPCYQVPLELDISDRKVLTRRLDRLFAQENPMTIKPELLDILACPQCKGDIRLRDDQSALVCDRCRLAYPIREDIPVMLIDEAEKIEAE